MRLIKLSTEAEFPEEQDLQKYFKEELPSRNPSGLFLLPSGWISKKGLRVGETLLFSYRNCQTAFFVTCIWFC